LVDPDRMTTAVRDGWFAWLTEGRPTTPVTWEDGVPRVRGPWAEARAAEVDAVLTRLGLSTGLRGVYEAHTQDRERDLASQLVAAGWRSGADDERRVVLRIAVVTTAARDAVRTGSFSWALSWSDPIGLTGPSGRVPLETWVDVALDGSWHPLVQGLGLHMAEAAPAADGTTPLHLVRPMPQAGTPAPLPDPPSPPFFRATGGWGWQGALPGRLLSGQVRVQIATDRIAIGGKAVRFDELAHLRLQLSPPRTTSSTIAAAIELVDRNGVRAAGRMSTSSGASGRNLLAAMEYIWVLVERKAFDRMVDELLERARRYEAKVGRMRLTPAGLAPMSRPDDLTPWVDVGDAVLTEREVLVMRRGKQPLRVPLGSMDALLLPPLLPRARVLLA
jgi:hypothetical protein